MKNKATELNKIAENVKKELQRKYKDKIQKEGQR